MSSWINAKHFGNLKKGCVGTSYQGGHSRGSRWSGEGARGVKSAEPCPGLSPCRMCILTGRVQRVLGDGHRMSAPAEPFFHRVLAGERWPLIGSAQRERPALWGEVAL